MDGVTETRIGTSGWAYPEWRGTFYPPELAQRRELEHLSRTVNSVELNNSFYALPKSSSFRRWREQTPDDFVFAVKGGRFITHVKKLREVRTPLANFFASGVLDLGPKLGPLLWQLPPSMPLDADRLIAFLTLLPHSTSAAAELAAEHDERMSDRASTSFDTDRPLRHTVEARHPSFHDQVFTELLREHGIGLVVADSAGTWVQLDDVTADFAYVRLHGDAELYASGYPTESLRRWADRVRTWRDGGTDSYIYFDNSMNAHAPHDAVALAALLDAG
ncbi:MAG: DUF72 domain-containing protein [Sciscionella sp.]